MCYVPQLRPAALGPPVGRRMLQMLQVQRAGCACCSLVKAALVVTRLSCTSSWPTRSGWCPSLPVIDSGTVTKSLHTGSDRVRAWMLKKGKGACQTSTSGPPARFVGRLTATFSSDSSGLSPSPGPQGDTGLLGHAGKRLDNQNERKPINIPHVPRGLRGWQPRTKQRQQMIARSLPLGKDVVPRSSSVSYAALLRLPLRFGTASVSILRTVRRMVVLASVCI